MIDVYYEAECDGDPEHLCEARFTYTPGQGKLGSIAGLRRQLDQRGWRVVLGSRPLRVLCPLHRGEGS